MVLKGKRAAKRPNFECLTCRELVLSFADTSTGLPRTAHPAPAASTVHPAPGTVTTLPLSVVASGAYSVCCGAS